ncbi:metallophosphoesterase family protein [Paenibacillus sp. EC2-1]|uniref:metallophosphoesterase family protein n=1 Tax=Paenibacillus sp. EC2-1 TaxID=3388665 RepID=UPI003BEF3AD0
MKRTLMISDIHGCMKQFDTLLQEVGYDSSKDQLILLGDYVDRGPHSKEVVDRVIDLVENHQAIALRGNHDQRLVDLIQVNNGEIQKKFLEHGGRETLESYTNEVFHPDAFEHAVKHIRSEYGRHIEFLKKLPFYYEDEAHIYVHAGINPSYVNWKEQSDHDFMYIKGEFHRAKLNMEKVIVFGHTRAIELHQTSDIWFGEGKIGIDGGCAYGMQLNGLMYQDGAYSTHYVKRES